MWKLRCMNCNCSMKIEIQIIEWECKYESKAVMTVHILSWMCLHWNVNAFFTALLLLYDVTNKASFDNIRVGHLCLISVWLTKAGMLYTGFGKWHNLWTPHWAESAQLSNTCCLSLPSPFIASTSLHPVPPFIASTSLQPVPLFIASTSLHNQYRPS